MSFSLRDQNDLRLKKPCLSIITTTLALLRTSLVDCVIQYYFMMYVVVDFADYAVNLNEDTKYNSFLASTK
jgi:hypothetical protein